MEKLLAARALGARSSVIRDLLRLVDQPGILSLAGGLPAPDGFPMERLQEAALRSLGASGPLGARALQYGPTEGDSELRELLAARSGVPVDELLVTAGSQQGLDLVARALVDPGDVVVVERPGYVGAIQALRATEPRLVGVHVDQDGMRTDELEELLRDGLRPKLVYTVPNFQNPMGVVLSEPRRRHLASLADRFGFVVVEDDPYGELRYDESPALPSVRSFGERVVSLGSTSKILAPGLRVGWVTAPVELVAPLVRLKQATDLHTSSLSQRIVLDVLGDVRFMTGQLARLRTLYAARATALVGALPSGIHAAAPRGGLFVWAEIDGCPDAAALLPVAVEHGVAFVPGSAFDLDDRPSGAVRLSFATLTPDALVEAAARLGRAACGSDVVEPVLGGRKPA